jgi:hypothetical protein
MKDKELIIGRYVPVIRNLLQIGYDFFIYLFIAFLQSTQDT